MELGAGGRGRIVSRWPDPPPRRRSPARLVRRVVGAVGLVAVGLAAVGFLLGGWNPWGLTALRYSPFANPMLGLLVVPVAALVASWLALPVDNETRQRGRIGFRAATAALAVLGLFGWGLFGAHFRFTVTEVVRSGDGDHAAAVVRDADSPPTSYVRIWHGSGLAAREVGELGRLCGAASMRFLDDHLLEVDTSYGTWRIPLDPATGVPRQVFGPGCADGPVPAGG